MNSKFSILIIDDEEEICMLLSHFLRKAGFEVNYAHNLVQGMNKYHELMPKLIFLDLHLPDGSGLTLIPEFNNDPEMKVVVISAYDSEKELAMKKGADAFISKPFSFDTVLETINILSTNDLNKKHGKDSYN